MATSVTVDMGIYDLTAKADLTPLLGEGAAPFSTAQPFTRERPAVQERYMTLEPGRFVLDGSLVPFPADTAGPDWGLWGSELSDSEGRLEKPVILTFAFAQPHSSIGITLYFDTAFGEAAGVVLARWFGENGTELARKRAAAGGPVWFLQKRVERYTRVELSFYGTAVPGRFLRVTGVEFGTRKIFKGDEIVSASLLGEIDPSGAELHYGTLELGIHSDEAAFSILNPDGIYYGLRQSQKLIVTETVDGEAQEMGVWYLQSWQCESEHSATFTAADTIWLLDGQPHPGGVYDTTAGQLCAGLLQGVEYTLHETLAGVPIQGWLAAGTRRSALQQLGFALGAVIEAGRDGVLHIAPPPERPQNYITKARKLNGASTVELLPLVTGVEVTAHTVSRGGEPEELYRGELDVGLHTLTLDAPAYCFTVSGGEIAQSGACAVTVRVSAPGEVVLSGTPYLLGRSVVSAAAGNLPLVHDENVLRVEDATLVSPTLAPVVATRLLEYHARRYLQTFRLKLQREELADAVMVQTFGGETLRGAIEGMEIDLAGGFLAECSVRGTRADSRWVYFGGELLAGAKGGGLL